MVMQTRCSNKQIQIPNELILLSQSRPMLSKDVTYLRCKGKDGFIRAIRDEFLSSDPSISGTIDSLIQLCQGDDTHGEVGNANAIACIGIRLRSP